MPSTKPRDPPSPSRGSAASRLLGDLVAVGCLVVRLDATAPLACAGLGGAPAAVAAHIATPTGVGFWRLDLGTAAGAAFWEAMAAEQQAPHRAVAAD